MVSKGENQIFDETVCPSIETLYGYKGGDLDDAWAYDVERHLVDCELCSEVVEGLHESDKATLLALTTVVNDQVDVSSGVGGRVVYMQAVKWAAAVAASVTIAVGAYQFFTEPAQEQIAQQSQVEHSNDKVAGSVQAIDEQDTQDNDGLLDRSDQQEESIDGVERNASSIELPALVSATEDGQNNAPGQEQTGDDDPIEQDQQLAISDDENNIVSEEGDQQQEPVTGIAAGSVIRPDARGKKKLDGPNVTKGVAFANDVYLQVDEMPQFPGGNMKMKLWIEKERKYSGEGKKRKAVDVSFIVNERGKLEGISILGSVNYKMDNEAYRIVKKMPKWIPGEQDGKKVKVRVTVPIVFSSR